MKTMIITLLAMLSTTAFAIENNSKMAEKSQVVGKEEVKELIEKVTENENTWGVYGTYSYLDMWVPSKLGIVVSYGDKDRVYELAYQSASLGYSMGGVIEDFGKITDTRIHLTTRSHTWGSSFKFQYGVYYNSFTVDLGTEFLRFVDAQYDVVKVQTIGAMFGMGNRWTWDNGLSISTDWFRMFYPIKLINEESDYLDNSTNSSDVDTMQDAIDAIKSFPTFTLAHFEIGYRF
jgi:hypothetical protein